MLKEHVIRFQAPENQPGLNFILDLIDKAPQEYFVIKSGDMIQVCELVELEELKEEPPLEVEEERVEDLDEEIEV
jgi:hypothetical protein